MYSVHQDATLIPLTFESPLYTLNGKNLPAINISASKDAKGLTHLSLVNIDSKKENKIEIDLKELGIKNVTGTIITSTKLQDHNTFDNPTKIQPVIFNGFEIKKGKLEIVTPPFSVVTLEGK